MQFQLTKSQPLAISANAKTTHCKKDTCIYSDGKINMFSFNNLHFQPMHFQCIQNSHAFPICCSFNALNCKPLQLQLLRFQPDAISNIFSLIFYNLENSLSTHCNFKILIFKPSEFQFFSTTALQCRHTHFYSMAVSLVFLLTTRRLEPSTFSISHIQSIYFNQLQTKHTLKRVQY